VTIDRRERLEEARLTLVCGTIDATTLEQALAGGVDIVQLRDDRATDAQISELARRFAPLCRAHQALLVLHGRPALVAPTGADGAHLSSADADAVAHARAQLEAGALLGVDCHSAGEIAAVGQLAVDYFQVGEGGITHASRNSTLPFFATGEIQPRTAGAAAAAGARRIAVSTAITEAEDPKFAAQVLRAEIESPTDFVERYRARTEAQNAAARAQLQPLAPDERPLPLKLAAGLAALAGVVNVIGFAAGATVNGSRLSCGEVAAFAVIAFILAAGLWNRNGLAVLATMAVLAIIVVLFSLFLIEASNVLGVVVPLIFIGVGGWLFWKLIRILGRIQAPRQYTASR